MTNNRRKYPF